MANFSHWMKIPVVLGLICIVNGGEFPAEFLARTFTVNLDTAGRFKMVAMVRLTVMLWVGELWEILTVYPLITSLW